MSIESIAKTTSQIPTYYLQESTIDTLISAIGRMEPNKMIHWKDTTGLQRKTFEFGISFKEAESSGKLVRYDIPDFIAAARKEAAELLEEHLEVKEPEEYENCILTIYGPGDGIKPHTDRKWFGRDIIGIIIEPDTSSQPEKSPSTLTFRKPGTDETISICEEKGAVFVLQGPLRSAWTHELSPVVTKRISLQFRTVFTDQMEKNPFY